MFYEKLSNEELQRFPYPNLIAELIESGHSICALGEHMGLGRHCQEDDPEVWARLKGKKDILAMEAFGLSNLFGVELKYLFSHELSMLDGKPFAYYRWYESNQKKKRDAEISELWYKIRNELDERPYFYDFMKAVISFSPDQMREVMVHMGQAPCERLGEPGRKEVCGND